MNLLPSRKEKHFSVSSNQEESGMLFNFASFKIYSLPVCIPGKKNRFSLLRIFWFNQLIDLIRLILCSTQMIQNGCYKRPQLLLTHEQIWQIKMA
jgi:hypothetical protein